MTYLPWTGRLLNLTQKLGLNTNIGVFGCQKRSVRGNVHGNGVLYHENREVPPPLRLSSSKSVPPSPLPSLYLCCVPTHYCWSTPITPSWNRMSFPVGGRQPLPVQKISLHDPLDPILLRVIIGHGSRCLCSVLMVCSSKMYLSVSWSPNNDTRQCACAVGQS